MTIPKPGDELKLRNGWPAKVLAVHPEQAWAIFIKYQGEDGIYVCAERLKNGQISKNAESSYDLMLPKPEPKRLRGWVNVYPGCLQGPFKSEDSARTHRQPYCEACLYIDRPYEEGEGL